VNHTVELAAWLTIPILPSISSTSVCKCEAEAVPPWRRLTELSACENCLNRRCWCLLELRRSSVTEKKISSRPSAAICERIDFTEPSFVIYGITQKVEQYLAQPVIVTEDPFGHPASIAQVNSRF